MDIGGYQSYSGVTQWSGPFVARNSAGRAVLLLLATLGMFVLGAYLAGLPASGLNFDDPNLRQLVGMILMFPSALFAVAWIRLLVDRRPQVVIDQRGIYLSGWSADIIPWSAVKEWRESAVHGSKMVRVDLNDAAAFEPSGSLGRSRSVLKASGLGDLFLSMTNTDRSHADLVAALRRFGNRQAKAPEPLVQA